MLRPSRSTSTTRASVTSASLVAARKSSSPMLLLMGGGALSQVAVLVSGIRAPDWIRYSATGLVVLLSLSCFALAIAQFLKKKAPPPARPLLRKERLEAAKAEAKDGNQP